MISHLNTKRRFILPNFLKKYEHSEDNKYIQYFFYYQSDHFQNMQFKFASLIWSVLVCVLTAQAYESTALYLEQQTYPIELEQNQYLKLKLMKSNNHVRDYGQILVDGQQMLLKVRGEGVVEVEGPGVVTIYRGIEEDDNMGFLGWSYQDIKAGAIKHVCEVGYAGRYCLFPVKNITNQTQLTINNNKTVVLEFRHSIQIVNLPHQASIQYCTNSTLSGCQKIQQNRMILSTNYFVVVRNQLPINTRQNLRSQEVVVKWVNFITSSSYNGPLFVYQNENSDSMFFKLSIFGLSLILLYRHYIKTQDQKKTIPVRSNQNQ